MHTQIEAREVLKVLFRKICFFVIYPQELFEK